MRNPKIDLLRYVGLTMIICAHLSPPDLLFQLRNFDVPLMVLISGASFQLSYTKREDYGSYLWKRFKRLVLPVWIFLTLYFLAVRLVVPGHPDLSAATVTGSYLLSEGIGYVWIIRVFLLMALVAPWLHRLNGAIRSNRDFILSFFAGLSLYHALRYSGIGEAFGGAWPGFVDSVLFYLIPYAFIYLLGIRLLQLPKRYVRGLFACFLVTFLLFTGYLFHQEGAFVQTQEFKYPVTFYYLSYALSVSVLLWITGGSLWEKLSRNGKAYVLFTSRNSIWIYLWHIPLIRCAQHLPLPFPTELLTTVALATGIVYVQVHLISSLVEPKIRGERIRRNVRLIMTG